MSGVVVFLGIIQFLVVSFVLLYEFKNKSPAVFLWATLWLMFGVMHLITSFANSDEYDKSVLAYTSVFVIMFSLVYVTVRAIFGTKIKKRYCQRLQIEAYGKTGTDISTRVYYCIFFLFCISVLGQVLPFIRYAGGILHTSWSEMRGYVADKSYFDISGVLGYIYFSCGGIVSLCWIKKDKVKLTIAVLLMLVNVIVMRNRVDILPLMCSFLTVFMMKQKKISVKLIAIGAMSCVVIIYVVYAIRAFRWLGSIGDAISNFSLKQITDQVMYFIQNDDGELGLRRYFYYFVSENNQFENFGKFHTYIRMLLVYLPTRLSGGIKPPDFAISMGMAAGGDATSSMHPTLFGDCYANLGGWGVMIGAWWAVLVSALDTLVLKFKDSYYMLMGYILCSASYVIIARGAVYNGFANIAWGLPLLFVFYVITNRLKYRY